MNEPAADREKQNLESIRTRRNEIALKDCSLCDHALVRMALAKRELETTVGGVTREPDRPAQCGYRQSNFVKRIDLFEAVEEIAPTHWVAV
jgi:hypothetical protein